MAEYINRDTFLEHERAWYCKDCNRRKNTRGKFVYEIGEAPCRACDIGTMLDAVEDYPAADVIEGLSGLIDHYGGETGIKNLEEYAKKYWDTLTKIPRWIPVAERLPKNQRPVLVYVPPYTVGEEEYVGYVGMAYFTYSPNGGFWCGTDGNIYGAIGFIHKPLAWMPLPSAPEPQKEET